MKNNYQHYVKVEINRSKEWLKTSLDLTEVYKNKMTGESLRSKKKYTFCPCDVIAYYTGSLKDIEGLGMSYIPAADVCNILDTVVPDSMGYETHIAARVIEISIGVNLNEYVAKKLHYTELELCKSLAAEQVDAVAMAIYNMEEKNQGMIIGDQTGIGKGRVAASMIRYAILAGHKPIFISEKPNLFSDLYRDLADIGSSKFVPFIVNAKEPKSDIKDAEGNIVYTAPPKALQESIIETQKLPGEYDFICSTYTQFRSPLTKPLKPMFLKKMAKGNLIILDESHNAGGESNTGEFMQDVVSICKGVIYLSATFAKTPKNMPIYAKKTSISEANMTNDELIDAISRGGVALQEILAAQLVAEGQMLRRERSSDGIITNFMTLEEKQEEHRAIFDNITGVLRDIIDFQTDYMKPAIDALDEVAAAEGKEIEERKGTNKAGVDSTSYFSKVFQVTTQILFSIKAKSVAEMAILRLEEGKKPVIAFSSTMGSFIDDLGSVGDTVNIDFAVVLKKGLDSILKYSEIDVEGKRTKKMFKLDEIGPEALAKYMEILDKINSISTGISVSPIDVIKDTIRKAGFSCDEVTGREYEVQLINDSMGVLLKRKKLLPVDAFRQFNNNELDCLLINQSGSTGASAHAVPTKLVPKEEVKQRVMLVLQSELNISLEVQKRGRINRTGQIMLPIYDYISSAIPAESRLMMMLRKKLKSLDANTTSNQKQSDDIVEVDDFLNKYGDKVVTDYLNENPLLNDSLGDPLNLEDTEGKVVDDAATKVSGRVAILPVKEQEKFYNDIVEQYNDHVAYLKQSGKYDLEVENLDLQSETLDKTVSIKGKTGKSVFAESAYLEKCQVNVLKKPFTKDELVNLIKSNLKGEDAKQQQIDILKAAQDSLLQRLDVDLETLNKRYEKLNAAITSEKAYKKLVGSKTKQDEFYSKRVNELETAKEGAIKIEKNKANSKFIYLRQYLSFFYVGKALNYPTGFLNENVRAVCVGINIDLKKTNPYAPSAIKIKVAISSSEKYIDLPLSGDQGKLLLAVMGASSGMRSNADSEVVENWEEYTSKSNVNRKDVFIVTGNILQGFSKYESGKLISFTSIDGGIRKGILLPDNYDPTKGEAENFVTVPIIQALNYILSLQEDSSVKSTDSRVQLENYSGGSNRDYRMTVPKSKAGRQYFTDTKIVKLCTSSEGFETMSDKMIAYFPKSSIEKLLKHLDSEHNVAILVSKSVFETYFDQKENKGSGKSKIVIQAEKSYNEDLEKFEQRRANKTDFKDEEKTKRLRIFKFKAAAALKLLELDNLDGLDSENEIVETLSEYGFTEHDKGSAMRTFTLRKKGLRAILHDAEKTLLVYAPDMDDYSGYSVSKLRSYLNDKMGSSSLSAPSSRLKKRIAEINELIESTNKQEIEAIEPDSTWESSYIFAPIEIKGNFVYIKYTEVYGNKKHKERFNTNNEMHLEFDLPQYLSWVRRAIKKGIRYSAKEYKAEEKRQRDYDNE